jgi:flagellar basal body-associated protein FliL
MIILIKIALALFLIGWSGLGLWMLVKYDSLFGYHPDDPAESSGARALNVTQVSSVWFGFFAVAFYFLIS